MDRNIHAFLSLVLAMVPHSEVDVALTRSRSRLDKLAVNGDQSKIGICVLSSW